LALGDGAFGAKLGALADDVLGRGVLVAGLAGAAACGRKLGEPGRPLGFELGALLAGRELGFAGAELAELGDDGGVSPGVLVREPPPLAAALAAAASAGLEAPRTGAGALFDGGGVATVWPDAEKAEPARGAVAGRAGLAGACFDGLDDAAAGRPPLEPAADDPESDDDPDGVAAGADGAGRLGACPALDAGAGREDAEAEPDGAEAGRDGADAGPDGAAVEPDGAEAGRDGAEAGREEVGAGRAGAAEAAGAALVAAGGAD
jgi:hypothetical protein